MAKPKSWKWLDASFNFDEMPEPFVVETAGWIVEEDEDFIVIASERTSEKTYRQLTRIPKVLLVTE